MLVFPRCGDDLGFVSTMSETPLSLKDTPVLSIVGGGGRGGGGGTTRWEVDMVGFLYPRKFDFCRVFKIRYFDYGFGLSSMAFLCGFSLCMWSGRSE